MVAVPEEALVALILDRQAASRKSPPPAKVVGAHAFAGYYQNESGQQFLGFGDLGAEGRKDVQVWSSALGWDKPLDIATLEPEETFIDPPEEDPRLTPDDHEWLDLFIATLIASRA